MYDYTDRPSEHRLLTLLQRMVQDDVRELCGVAQSNSRVFPCKFIACCAIALGMLSERYFFQELSD
jgi:hypothetical protein